MRVYMKGVFLGLILLMVLLLVYKHMRGRRGVAGNDDKSGKLPKKRARAGGAVGSALRKAAIKSDGRAGGAAGARAGRAGGRAAAGGRAGGKQGGPKNSPRSQSTSDESSAPARGGDDQQRFGFQPWRGRPKPPQKLVDESQVWLKDMKYPSWYTSSVKRSKVYGKENEFVGYKPLFSEPCENAAAVKAKYKKDGVQTFTYIRPGKFIPESKNPCWYDKEGKMLCIPYFYVAGVAKCGTTDLYKRIRYHPDIMEGELKEYHWWDRLRYGAPMELKFTDDSEKNDKPLPLEEYSRIITGKEIIDLQNDLELKGYSDRICGDGSPSYLWDASQWTIFEGNEGCTEPKIVSGSFIQYANKNSKFFLIFRHPTQRLYSRFLSRIPRYPPFKGATPQMFHDYVVKGVECYKRCFRQRSIRECAYNETLYDEAVLRIIEGMYSVFLEDWLRIFKRDQIMVIRNEDYSEDIEGHVIDAFEFLGAANLRKSQMRPILTHVSTNIGQNYDTVGPMLPETIDVLNEFYKPFVLRLAELLEDERFLWKDIVVT